MQQQYIQIIITALIILAIYYFFEWQRKKQNEQTKKMQNEIKVGDKIITYTGLSGVVSEVLEDRIKLKTNPKECEVTKKKWAIAGIDDRSIENQINK